MPKACRLNTLATWPRAGLLFNHSFDLKKPIVPAACALLILALVVPTAFAAVVTATIKGTVKSGTDTSGMFGVAPGASLAGQSFTLIFTFDDTKGTKTSSSGTSKITSTSTTSGPAPGTAVIQVNGISFDLSALQTTYYQSSTQRSGAPIYAAAFYFFLEDGFYSPQNAVDISISPNDSASLTSTNWESAYSSTDISSSTASVNIDETANGFNANMILNPQSIVISGPEVTNPIAKDLGSGNALGSTCSCSGSNPVVSSDGRASGGDPISVGTGNVFYQVTDYTTAAQNPLQFVRYYNSMGNANGINTFSSVLGINWRSNFDRYLQIGSSTVGAERPDGRILSFTQSGSNWVSDSDVDVTLTQSGSTWTLTDRDDTVETYNNATGIFYDLTTTYGQLASIKKRNGYTQTLNYAGGALTSVIDSYGRILSFTLSGGYLSRITTPDSLILTYSLTAVTSGGAQLTTVSYNTSPASHQTYLYSNSEYPFALTGITDENGNRFATWAYDTAGHGTSSQLGAGALLTSVAFNQDGTVNITNPFGVADTYTVATIQNLQKVTKISRAATTTTAAATEAFTYDSNGYIASRTDWNGNQTTYVNDAHGDPITTTEALGTSAQRTTTIAYDPTWVHLPSTITTSGLTTNYAYDGSGELLTKTLSDTTTSGTPYSTKGQTRTWTNAWSNFLLSSAQTPNGNTTKFGYDSSGALTSTTDALGHVTNITSHTGGGLPLVVVDPNQVTTTLTYDARQKPTSSAVSGSTGTFTTSWSYDPTEQLLKTTLPDSSYLMDGYDTAHRLTKVTDALGNYISYTLDALGDRTQTTISTSGGTVTWKRSGSFDALGRELLETAGAGQATTRTFDPNGNVRTVVDGLQNKTTNIYDALNRLSGSTDANGGATAPTYDTHDRVVSVTDANGNGTTYIRNGFGDVIQQVSPDSGTTVFHFDPDGNLTTKTDAVGIVTNQTFDALERPLTTTYPADGAENVSYTYDQNGTGFSFGIGRLTSVTDAAGSLTRTYEERGNLASESRVNGSTTLTTAYTYDGVNRVASMTYPDGTFVGYSHDAAGYLSTVTAKPSGSSTTTTLATLTHQPFGPQSGVAYGNGIAETWTFDSDYRAMTIKDLLSATSLQSLSYVYDSANNVKSIADAVSASNSQTLGYDVVNRLTSATSGSGGYGTFGWTYDKVGNRLTQVQGTTTTTYGYTSGTNRLATISVASTHASLQKPRRISSQRPPVFSAQLAARFPFGESSRADKPALPTVRPAGLLGWPMLVTGFAVIFTLRRRLRDNALFALIGIGALLTGSVSLFSGCGSGTSGKEGASNPATAATPTFSPLAGSYTAIQSVTISDATAGSSIYYTTNGATPTTASMLYSGPLAVNGSETIQAIATASGYSTSATGSASYTIALPAATPALSLAAGIYTSAQTVTISDATPGSSIYYTTNGTTPSAGSTLYTGSITVGTSEMIEAIAVASGYSTSAVVSAAYTISLPAATPILSLATGTYISAQTVAIMDATPGVSIYYTTNGTAPTAASTLYTAPIAVSSSETIEAVAIGSGSSASPIASATYTINPPTATPILSPPAGSYSSYQSVSITDGTGGASIYYTTNGSTPTLSSTPYTGPIAVQGSETIEAVAIASGYSISGVGTAAYAIKLPIVATPSFAPPAGTYIGTQSVAISDATSGAAIYYTTNGSTPTAASTPYVGPVTVAASETIQAVAAATGYTTSTVGNAAYTISLPQAATPTFAPGAGTYMASQVVAITDATPGASIYYTTDGTTPTAASTLYSGPVAVGSSEALQAIAIANGYTSSVVGSAGYTISTPTGTNVITNANGDITGVPSADGASYLTFTYNKANRAASVTGSPLAATFVYDWAGQRYSKTNPGMSPTVYSYSQSGQLIGENDNGTATDYIYADGRPIAVVQPNASPAANQVDYVIADHLGTPQVVANGSGSVVWNTTYQPFGTTGLVGASITQNLRFPGQNFDAETGFSYNLNRDYMPNTGRYLETDPVGIDGGINPYRYVRDNPIIWTDRSGLSVDWNTFTPVTIGGSSGPSANPPLATSNATSIAPQVVQNSLDWLRSLFPDFGGNLDLINSLVDTVGNVGNAVTQCPAGVAQAYKYYSNPAAPYDPASDPGGWQTTPVDPDISSWQSRFANWFNQWQQRQYGEAQPSP